MIIETTANQFYEVFDAAEPELSHVWKGQRVKRTAQGFVPVGKMRIELVRKLGSRIINQ